MAVGKDQKTQDSSTVGSPVEAAQERSENEVGLKERCLITLPMRGHSPLVHAEEEEEAGMPSIRKDVRPAGRQARTHIRSTQPSSQSVQLVNLMALIPE